MPKLCNSGFWRLRRFPSYRLLTGPKVGNLYAQLPAAKCPACSRSEKKVKPGCKHEESRPARCGQNLGKSKSKMPQITALPYFNLWNDLFRLIFLKMLQTFFEPITKDSEKKKLCFFGCNLRISVGAFFSCEDTKPESWKRYDFVTIPKPSGKNWLILTTKTGPKLLWTYDRYNKICPARYYLPPSLLTSIWSTRFNSQDWGERVIPRCNDASSNVMCQVGPKKHKIHLGLKHLFVLKSFVLLDSMIQMTHIYTSDSAFRVGNLEMSNVFSALAKTVVQKEHIYLAVSHIHTFYMFDIFSKQVPCFDLFLVLWIPQTQLICGKHRLWLQSNSWILLQIHQLCADPFENRAGILRDLDQAGPWRDVFHEKSCFVWRWHHCVFFVSLELEIWEKAYFWGVAHIKLRVNSFIHNKFEKFGFELLLYCPSNLTPF